MTAYEQRQHHLTCDSRDCYTSPSPARFLGEIGESRAALRKRAAKAGWTHVHREGRPRSSDTDFCPQHKPGKES